MRRIMLVALLLLLTAAPAEAQSYFPIRGSGSSWSENAIKQWISDASTFGLTASYSGTGSSAGRLDFAQKMNDFGVSEIPFQGVDPTTGNADNSNGRPYAYMPIVAGGTSFMYKITINGQLVRDLRLSGETVAKIFTGKITDWSDDQITSDNNGRKLPKKRIVPVVRSDGSGTTAQFTLWMSKQHSGTYCPFFAQHVNASKPCGLTSYYPTFGNAVAQSGSAQMAGYISAEYGEGTIGYVEYSYPRALKYPVAKIRNAADYFAEPTDYNVAVALQFARINRNAGDQNYLTQILDDVYTSNDPRTYPLSSYSYMILPISEDGKTTKESGRTLSAFARYFLCQGQQKMGPLGYSPLPLNLVKAGFEQVAKVPGAEQAQLNPVGCRNPTFDPNDPESNLLAKTAPMPQECDKAGKGPCGSGGSNNPNDPGQQQNNGQQQQGNPDPNAGTDPNALADIDPLTGQSIDSGKRRSATGSATELAAARGEGMTTWLAILASVQLALVLVVPTFVARAVRRRRTGGS